MNFCSHDAIRYDEVNAETPDFDDRPGIGILVDWAIWRKSNVTIGKSSGKATKLFHRQKRYLMDRHVVRVAIEKDLTLQVH